MARTAADDDDDGQREDVAQALVRELALDKGEADVAIVATRLCGGTGGDRFRVAPTSKEPSPGLRLALARIFATGALASLAEHGTRSRTVLRRGRRKTGGLLDADINVDDDGAQFALRFSPAVVDVVFQLCVRVLPFAHGVAASAPPRARDAAERSLVQHLRPSPTTTAGDDVVYALIHDHLDRLDLPPTLVQRIRVELRDASPLCTLLSPGVGGPRDVDLDGLVAPGGVRVLECLHDVVVAAWERAPRVVWLAPDLGALVDQSRATVALARRFLGVLDRAERLDLAAPVVALVAATSTSWPADARARLTERRGVQTMVDREQAIAALRALADVSADLDALRDRVAALRYGDDRFDEAQLVLAMLRDRWLPHRDEVAAVVQRLTGAIA